MKTKALLFCSPSNPTGSVYSTAEIKEIWAWLKEHGIWVITDEIYEHLLYDDVDTGSLPVLCPGVRDTCIVVNGVAKTYAMTGWRLGWLVVPETLVPVFEKLAQNLYICASTLAFDPRRKTMVSMLNEIDGVVCPVPQGAFYCYPSVKGLLGRDIDGAVATSSAELAEIFLEKAEVAVVPGEAFGSPGYVRLSYALGDEDLAEGIGRLQKLLAKG